MGALLKADSAFRVFVTCLLVVAAWTVSAACQGPPSMVVVDGAPVPEFDDAAAGEERWPRAEALPAAFDFPPWVTLPAPTTIVISWRSLFPSTGRVQYGTTRAYGATRFSTEQTALHHVRLGNLTAATTYFYQVEIDGSDDRVKGTFTTPGRTDMRFIHLAEFHAASDSANVANFAQTIRSFRPQLIVESSDMVNNGDNLADWRSYMRTSAPWISNVILLPIGSNHVQGPAGNPTFLRLFELPNNERWYRTRYGPVEFLSLDSTFDLQTPDIVIVEPQWVGEQAALAHDGIDDPSFLVATWHYPACSSHYKSRAALRNWVMDNFIAQFNANGGLDLALVGHDKYYERSTITGGIVHVQSAVGRLSPSTEGDNHPDCVPQVTRTDTRSLLMVQVDETSLTAFAVDEQGDRIDAFTIAK